ncbi:MAG TPA: hypothetical protein VIH72_03845 [Candidatus Acidoferrales bacterium]
MSHSTRTRILIRFLAANLVVIALGVCVAAQSEGPPSSSELEAISARGKLLSAYDVAAWHATDAVQSLPADKTRVGRYIARQSGNGWRVAFGKLNEAQDKFLVAYEASQGATPVQFTVASFDPPKEDTGFYLAGANAIDTALADFKGEKRPYNAAVLPADRGKLFVYVYPAQTKASAYPMGGDVRYLISADGKTIIEKRQLHKSISENDYSNKSIKVQAGYHTHVLSDLPEDTDVFYVLTRKPPIPEYVTSSKFMYQISPSGSITFMGKTQDVLKKK